MLCSVLKNQSKNLKSLTKAGNCNNFIRVISSDSSNTLTYTERQSLLGRPLSPHVQIYAFPITALSSIAVRVTACALTAGVGGVSALAFIGADVPGLINSAQNNIPLFTPLAKFCVAFPLSYHFLGGVRHMIWDNVPEMLTNDQVPISSYALIGTSTAFSLGACFYTINSEGNEKEEN